MTELPQEIQDLINASDEQTTEQLVELAVGYAHKTHNRIEKDTQLDLDDKIEAIKQSETNSDALYNIAQFLSSFSTKYDLPESDNDAYTLATKAFNMGHAKAGTLIAHLSTYVENADLSKLPEVYRLTLKRDPDEGEELHEIYGYATEGFLSSLQRTDKTDLDIRTLQNIGVIGEIGEILADQTPSNNLKFTWGRVTDPELLEEARAALLRIEDPAVNFDEQDIFAYPLSQAITYLQEQKKIAERRTGLTHIENSPTYEDVENQATNRYFDVTKIDTSSEGHARLSTYTRTIMDPEGLDIIVTGQDLLEFSGANIINDTAIFREPEAF